MDADFNRRFSQFFDLDVQLDIHKYQRGQRNTISQILH